MHKNIYLCKILHGLICSRRKKEMSQDDSAPLIISTRALNWWQFCFKLSYFKLNSPYIKKLLTRLIYMHIRAFQFWCQLRNLNITLQISSEMLWKEAGHQPAGIWLFTDHSAAI